MNLSKKKSKGLLVAGREAKACKNRVQKIEKTLRILQFKGFFKVWWMRVDSNHRSRRQQIYSLPPLATRELIHMELVF